MPERTDESKSQLRRRMLDIARLHGPRYDDHFVPARNFLSAVDDEAVGVADQDECESLLADLLGWGLIAAAPQRDLGGTKELFAHRRFKLTKKGRALWLEEIDPIAGVADKRFGDD